MITPIICKLIISNLRTIQDVPVEILQEVKDELIAQGYEHLTL